MTLRTLARAIKAKKPAVIKEKGAPRFVVLDWEVYRKLQDIRDEYLDELEDEREINDPKIQEIIREGTREYRAGKSRPIEEFLAELDVVRDKPRHSMRYRAKRR